MLENELSIFLYEFFWPWKGYPSNYNSEPLYIGKDETLSGNKVLFNVRPKFEEPHWVERIQARYDNGTGTPVFGTNPKIQLNYFDWSPVQQKPVCIDTQTSPGEGNAFYYGLPYDLFFGGGKHGFDVVVTNFGAYTHLALLIIGRIQYNEPDI